MRRLWQLYYEIAAAQVESQERQNQDIERKSQRFTTAAAATTGLLVTFLTGYGLVVEKWLVVPAAAVAVLLLTSVLLTFLVMRIQEFSIGPRLDVLEQDILESGSSPDPEAHIYRRAGASTHEAYCDNEDTMSRKARLLLWNIVVTCLLLVPALSLVAVALVSNIAGAPTR